MSTITPPPGTATTPFPTGCSAMSSSSTARPGPSWRCPPPATASVSSTPPTPAATGSVWKQKKARPADSFRSAVTVGCWPRPSHSPRSTWLRANAATSSSTSPTFLSAAGSPCATPPPRVACATSCGSTSCVGDGTTAAYRLGSPPPSRGSRRARRCRCGSSTSAGRTPARTARTAGAGSCGPSTAGRSTPVPCWRPRAWAAWSGGVSAAISTTPCMSTSPSSRSSPGAAGHRPPRTPAGRTPWTSGRTRWWRFSHGSPATKAATCLHCHNLEHEDMAMMANFQVV